MRHGACASATTRGQSQQENLRRAGMQRYHEIEVVTSIFVLQINLLLHWTA